MSEKDEQREWLRLRLAAAGRGAKIRLARFLNVAPDAITRMLNTDPDKEGRAIKSDEFAKMQKFFADGDPEKAETDAAKILALVHSWQERGEPNLIRLLRLNAESIQETRLDAGEAPAPAEKTS